MTSSPCQPDHFVITADRTWDGVSPSSHSDRAVVVRDGRIESIGSRSDAPAGLPWFEFPRCTVLPGLIDAHVHLAAWMLPVFLAAGVTTVRDLGNDLGTVLSLRELTRDHPTLGPSILLSGPLLDGSFVHWPLIGRGHHTSAAIRESVAELAAAGVNAIKLYAHLDVPRLAAAVDAAHRHGLRAVAHLGDVTAQQAAAAGVDEIQHFSGCEAAWEQPDEQRLAELADTLLGADIVVCPTLAVWDRLSRPFDPALDRDVLLDWVPQGLRKTWQNNAYRHRGAPTRLKLQASVVNLKQSLQFVHRRGVPIIVGSDTPFPYLIPGFSLHDELALMVDAGLEPVDALRSATSVSATALGLPGTIGSLAVGASADLLIVRGDPLTDISSIADTEAVFKTGARVVPADLRLRCTELYQETSLSPIEQSLEEWARLARVSAEQS